MLAIFLRRRDFLPVYAHLMRPGHFGTPLMRDTALLILDLFRRYGVAPSVDSLREEIDRDCKKRALRLPKGVPEEWQRLVGDLDRVNLSDAKIIRQQVIRWVQERVFEQAIVQLATLRDRMTETGELDLGRAKRIITEASHVGQDAVTTRLDYFTNMDQRIARLYLDDGQMGLRVPLLLSEVDQQLDGGPRRKEMVVWASPTGRGKTHALTWCAKAALYQGKNVAFITAEMTKDAIAGRIDGAISNLSPRERRADPDLTRRRIEAARRYQGRLIVFDIGGRHATVDQIHSNLEVESAETGFIPDVICVDYPGVMRGRSKHEHRREEWAEIYTDLHGLVKEWDAVLHVPIQTNKASLSRATITERDFAECFEVAWHADLIFGLCQTDDEREHGLMRFACAKHREGKGHWVVPLYFNPATGNFTKAGDAAPGLVSKLDTDESSIAAHARGRG